jgi:hypothetical protein
VGLGQASEGVFIPRVRLRHRRMGEEKGQPSELRPQASCTNRLRLKRQQLVKAGPVPQEQGLASAKWHPKHEVRGGMAG